MIEVKFKYNGRRSTCRTAYFNSMALALEFAARCVASPDWDRMSVFEECIVIYSA